MSLYSGCTEAGEGDLVERTLFFLKGPYHLDFPPLHPTTPTLSPLASGVVTQKVGVVSGVVVSRGVLPSHSTGN